MFTTLNATSDLPAPLQAGKILVNSFYNLICLRNKLPHALVACFVQSILMQFHENVPNFAKTLHFHYKLPFLVLNLKFFNLIWSHLGSNSNL